MSARAEGWWGDLAWSLVSGRRARGEDQAGRKNMFQLVQLRWLAVLGQVATIAGVQLLLGVSLPLVPMAGVVGLLVVANLASLLRLRRPTDVANAEIFGFLVLDMAALTAQLYLSGGASNPFVSLYLLQVVLSAVLLESWSTCVMVALAGACLSLLALGSLPLPLHHVGAAERFDLQVQGALIAFLLDAVLLVVFVTRINRNLRGRDARLADLRQQAAEENHIVRMGLLASGAAHELGTPLATLSVILNDWRRDPLLRADPERVQEIDDMDAEVRRCKAIVTGILLSAGEARGEATVVTSVTAFFDEVVAEWRPARAVAHFLYDDAFGPDLQIVSDAALKQVVFNVLDNAADASPDWVEFRVGRDREDIVLSITDRGPGFSAQMLEAFGRPYQSSKGRVGGGLGLFLVVNAIRKLGGSVTAGAGEGGGAVVTLLLPLKALRLPEPVHVG